MCLQFFFFQAEDGIRDDLVTGVQTCALPIFHSMIFNPFVAANWAFAANMISPIFTLLGQLISHVRHPIQEVIYLSYLSDASMPPSITAFIKVSLPRATHVSSFFIPYVG